MRSALLTAPPHRLLAALDVDGGSLDTQAAEAALAALGNADVKQHLLR